MDNAYNFVLALPEILLLGCAVAVLLIDAFAGVAHRRTTFALTLLTLTLLAVVSLWQWQAGVAGATFHGLYVADALSHGMKLLSYIVVAVTLVYGRVYVEARDMLKQGGEFYTLALFALLGQMVMISAHHMLSVYLGLELMSLALYALVAVRRDHLPAVESAMKYFVLGSLASGIMLYGVSMLYGATGTLDLGEMARVVQAGQASNMALTFGLVFVVAGLAFKLGAVPFHMWVPDVYHGAPTAVTLVVGAAPKLAAFAMTLRVLVDGLHGLALAWQPMLLIMAVLSLAIGNLTAIMQSNFKRMLAYSTISHTGFILLGLLAGVGQDGTVYGQAYSAALFYMVVYVLTTLSTFGLILILSAKGFECEQISDLRGLNQRSPLLAGVVLLSMFSLAGIPPLAGFYAKLAVLQALIQAGWLWLAVVAVLFALIGAFYYLRVVKVVYFDAPENHDTKAALDAPTWRISHGVLAGNGLLLLVLGLLPGGLMTLCIHALRQSLGY